MRHTRVAPVPLGVTSLSARAAVRSTKVSRCAAKSQGTRTLALRSVPVVATAAVPSEVLANTVPVPVNGDAAHVTCGASLLSTFPASLLENRGS
jgi:hypothetical protein